MKRILNRQTRKYIYTVSLAFVGLAVYLGWISVEALPVIVPLVLALLNLTPDDVKGDHAA